MLNPNARGCQVGPSTISMKSVAGRIELLPLLMKERARRDALAIVRQYTNAMPSRVYVQLRDVSKPSIVKDGDTVHVDKDTGELTVKDAAGEPLGWFENSSVVGWWKEHEPLDPRDLSSKDLDRIMAEIQKHGMMEAPDH